VLFVIPWGAHWIVGTTDTPWALDRDHPAASRRDIDYLLGHVNAVLRDPLGHADIVGVYAGLRPLVPRSAAATTALPRQHIVGGRSVVGVTDEGGHDDGGGQDVQRHERDLGGGAGPGDRRNTRHRGQRHGRLADAATGRAGTAVEHREERTADHGAQQRHLGEAHKRDHLAVDLERHAGHVHPRGGDAGGDRGGDQTSNHGGPPQRPADRVGAYGAAAAAGAAVVVRDMAFSVGWAAPGAPLTTPTNATTRLDSRPGGNLLEPSCRNRRARS
jgi:hypothetical protein